MSLFKELILCKHGFCHSEFIWESSLELIKTPNQVQSGNVGTNYLFNSFKEFLINSSRLQSGNSDNILFTAFSDEAIL